MAFRPRQRQRQHQSITMAIQSLLLLAFLLFPVVSCFTTAPRVHSSFDHWDSLCRLHQSTSEQQQTSSSSEAIAPDSAYFSIPDPSTVPSRSTSQRITLTRYLDNVVKENPEVSVCNEFSLVMLRLLLLMVGLIVCMLPSIRPLTLNSFLRLARSNPLPFSSTRSSYSLANTHLPH